MLAQEAKERQRQAGRDKKSEKAKKADQPQDVAVSTTGKTKKSLIQKIGQPMLKSDDQAAKVVGTNKQEETKRARKPKKQTNHKILWFLLPVRVKNRLCKKLHNRSVKRLVTKLQR